MVKGYDFAGWASRNNVKCSDGRTIQENAFKHQDGTQVPLVWNHNHKDANNVLGHAILENRKEGVYAYGFFNDSPQGENARNLVKHKDVSSLSIYANGLKEKVKNVVHGVIREVSLVLAGANPGAYIETVLEHSDDSTEEAKIFNASEGLVLEHSEDTDPDEDNKDQKEKDEQDLEHGDDPKSKKEADKPMAKDEEKKDKKTVQDVFDEMSEEQQNVVYALIGAALDEQKDEDDKNKKDEDKEGDQKMKHNLFEGDQDQDLQNQENVLSHSEMQEIFEDAKRIGSMKESFLQHGITDVDVLFPEAQAVNRTPEMIQRDMGWVQKVMSKVKKSPFSRVKSTAVNVTEDQARARGYVKGNQKVEEVISALKRTTNPTTVYKFQKMDRDDVVDITDFDVIKWLKLEMKTMLDEEVARAILIGDGRLSSSDDKINPLNVRPILGDDETYAIKRIVDGDGVSDTEFAKAFIKDVIRSRVDYKGSGNPTLYTTEEMLTEMLLIQDAQGRDIYTNVSQLATKLRVKEIITVPVMENVVRTDDSKDYTACGIMVNLSDYNVGADKGGKTEFFEDFDLNYNKHEYLIESRFSGALVKPYSAVTFEKETPESV